MESPHAGPCDRIAMVARWKPVHLGHERVLRALARSCRDLAIGLGSSNRYDVRNPFTAAESREMIERALAGAEGARLRFIEVPDLDDGPRWRLMVKDLFGPLDVFVTANDYVRSLLAADYRVVHPVAFLAPDERIPLDATMVREAMARGDDWVRLVPPAVAAYIRGRGLDERFRREFGLATLLTCALNPKRPPHWGPPLA